MTVSPPPAPPSPTELIAAYERGPDELAALVVGLTREQMLARPVAGKWSTLEVLCHLSDSEQVYADRIKRTIAMPTPLVLGFDEGRYAKALAYHQREPEEELALLRATRRQVARILRTLPAEAWERPAIHNEVGLRTLRQFVETTVAHIAHHGRFVAEKRQALGI